MNQRSAQLYIIIMEWEVRGEQTNRSIRDVILTLTFSIKDLWLDSSVKIKNKNNKRTKFKWQPCTSLQVNETKTRSNYLTSTEPELVSGRAEAAEGEPGFACSACILTLTSMLVYMALRGTVCSNTPPSPSPHLTSPASSIAISHFHIVHLRFAFITWRIFQRILETIESVILLKFCKRKKRDIIRKQNIRFVSIT